MAKASRLNLKLTQTATDTLSMICEATDETKTAVVSRAISLYALLLVEAGENGKDIYLSDNNGHVQALKFL